MNKRQVEINADLIAEYQAQQEAQRQVKLEEGMRSIYEHAKSLGIMLVGIPKIDNGKIVADWGVVEWPK